MIGALTLLQIPFLSALLALGWLPAPPFILRSTAILALHWGKAWGTLQRWQWQHALGLQSSDTRPLLILFWGTKPCLFHIVPFLYIRAVRSSHLAYLKMSSCNNFTHTYTYTDFSLFLVLFLPCTPTSYQRLDVTPLLKNQKRAVNYQMTTNLGVQYHNNLALRPFLDNVTSLWVPEHMERE